MLGPRKAAALVAERYDVNQRIDELRRDANALAAKRGTLDAELEPWLRSQITKAAPAKSINFRNRVYLVRFVGKRRSPSYRGELLKYIDEEELAALRAAQPFVERISVEAQ